MRQRDVARAMVVGMLVLAAGCAQRRELVPAGTSEADQFLFEKGETALKDRKWVNAREYYRQIVDNYPQSTYRPDAKLAVGDTYVGEHTTESLLLAINEYREFLTFYPTHARADYAQYQLANAFTEQMPRPERDQSATRDALKELNTFVERYPNSQLMPEAQKKLREVKDQLSEASYRVGFYYYRVKWWTGATDRFKEVLATDPDYTNRDAVYYYYGESLVRWAADLAVREPAQAIAKRAEALPYFERVLSEFETSEYIERSKKRIAEIKGGEPLPPSTEPQPKKGT